MTRSMYCSSCCTHEFEKCMSDDAQCCMHT